MRKAAFVGKVELKMKIRKIKKMNKILWGGSDRVDKCLCNIIVKIKVSKIVFLWELRNVS